MQTKYVLAAAYDCDNAATADLHIFAGREFLFRVLCEEIDEGFAMSAEAATTFIDEAERGVDNEPVSFPYYGIRRPIDGGTLVLRVLL